ncbi:MAG: SDR family NAD(P)-dependent oxidoreductase [Deltaproteobacteria bacterium]|nr:MAG: SDR family NAD(P)-dependent oxidoreductase [Deltaproteobacteria bacterium]
MQRSAALAPLIAELGAPHALVSNAGVTRDGLFALMPQKHWDEVVATRLGGFAHVTAAVVRGMVGRRAAGSSRPVPRRDRLAWAAKAGLVRGRKRSRASSAATGSGHRRPDNALLWLEEPGRAQRLADRFATLPWPAVLDGFARRVIPLLRDLLQGYRYYWQPTRPSTPPTCCSRAARRCTPSTPGCCAMPRSACAPRTCSPSSGASSMAASPASS